MTALSAKDKRDWLRLIRSENVGPVTFYRLIERYGTATRALEALPDLAARGGKTNFKIASVSSVDDEIARIEKSGAKLIAKGEPDYPQLLAEIEDAPPLLTIKGRVDLLNKPTLGIVGARNASLAGKRLAEDLSRQISTAGYVIASGLARGIDTAAHTASLSGGTVAAVAGGVDVVYPPENQKLYEQLSIEGCVVAESPFATEPLARHFPRRNRIISGLSLGVLIVEAAAKSGSLITARMALEQNREVFAVPGSPLDPRAEGGNRLIKDGAHLVMRADDILQVMDSLRLRPLRDGGRDWQAGGAIPPAADSGPDDKLRDLILENLSPTPTDLNDLIRTVQAPIPLVLTVILELELAGRIERQAGNKINLV